MNKPSKLLERLENKIHNWYLKHKKRIPAYIFAAIGILYFYGMFVNSFRNGISNTFSETALPLLILSPIKNISAVFSSEGAGILFFAVVMYILISKKGQHLISGHRVIKDKTRNIEILPDDGTYGTSSWLTRRELTPELFETGSPKNMNVPLIGRLGDGNDDFIGIKSIRGMNGNFLVYGAPGSGKSSGLVIPYVLQAVKRRESCILVDPKANLYEILAPYLKSQGYTVKCFNLLDMENSDGWNVLNDTYENTNLVQTVAEVIIRNTSNASEKQDFWEKSEKNLLMALMLYVQSLTEPGTNRLLPVEQRSLGAIYKIMTSTSFTTLDSMFKALPMGHPALSPYGIFKQAARQLWGNIAIGLGSRLNVFQNSLVDTITRYNEIDLELPGKQPCAYFCIISDQESSMEFLSSLFFSVLFMRLSDYARKCGNNGRLPVTVNCVLDEFANVGKLMDFKKFISVSRSRGINCQLILQSAAQFADRYPGKEWEEISGDCDIQICLGCNDMMTAELISKKCGTMSVRVNNASMPMQPLFSPVISSNRTYTEQKHAVQRALILPDEIMRMPRDECIALIRGVRPMKLNKIMPEQMPEYSKLTPCKIGEYIPKWRQDKDIKQKNTIYEDIFEAKKDEQLEFKTHQDDADTGVPHAIPAVKVSSLEEISTDDV